jgi:glycosyltransferase involved in cell wall biosynthesis
VKIGVRYVGPALDVSGYASACRNYIDALIDSGEVDLTVKPVSFEQQKTTHGKLAQKIEPFINRSLKYKIQIIHLTPENYPIHVKPNCYNIGYTVWETEQLPNQWATLCNKMDEIWVPSQWNVKVFKESGVTVPVYKVPHVISIPDMSDMKPITIGADRDTYVFYSILQWIERKGATSLLKAYLTEFNSDENVCLALKAYRLNTSGKEQEIIKQDIGRIKKALNLKEFPPIFFFGNLLPAEYMKGFHSRGDCFVSAHRAEGWGICPAEAMSLGKPVIATGYSGNLEFMNEENSFLVRCQRTPVFNMLFPAYHGRMTWGDPDIMHLRKLMRYCYENQKEAKAKGVIAKKFIEENLNKKRIGSLITNRLKEIVATRR